jgi:DNA-binding CsgD family transcriptional regulator
MAGEAELRKLSSEYEAVLGGRRFRPEDLDYSRLDYHLPLLERLDQVERSSVALYDLNRRSYAFLTGSFKFLLGYDRAAAASEGPGYFFERMHPADLPFVLDTVTRALRFHYGLPPGEGGHYRLSFDFRMRRAGEAAWLRLVQQVLALEQDARGGLWLVLIVNDALEGEAGDRPPRRELVDLRSGRRRLFEEPPAAGGGRALSPREEEILGLVASGLASREIAESLSISVATVNNHRQRILEKTGARNSAEAVLYARRLGLAGARR